jgi:hypothetical protein
MTRKAVWGGAIALLVMMGAAAPAAAQVELVQQAIVDVTGTTTTGHTTTADWCDVVKVTNLVAWRLWTNHGAPAPFGLLEKAGGTRAVLKADGSCVDGDHSTDPAGFALDYLIERASGAGRDIVTSWGAAQWPSAQETTMQDRNWRYFAEPVDPAPYLISTHIPQVIPPNTAPPAPPIVVVPAASSGVEGILFAKVEQLAARVEQLYALEAEQSRADGEAHASIAQNVTDGRNEARPAIETVKAIGSFVVKYVAPAVGGWLTARHFQ